MVALDEQFHRKAGGSVGAAVAEVSVLRRLARILPGVIVRVIAGIILVTVGTGAVMGEWQGHLQRGIVSGHRVVPIQCAWVRVGPTEKLDKLRGPFVQYLDREIGHLGPDNSLQFYGNPRGRPVVRCGGGECRLTLLLATGQKVSLEAYFGRGGFGLSRGSWIGDSVYFYAPYLRPIPPGFGGWVCRTFSLHPGTAVEKPR